MWLDILAVSLWGGLVALDTTAAFQILISHPLFACSVVGLMLGNAPLGFAFGIILELVWLNEMPIGAAKFSEGNIGAVSATAIAIITMEHTTRAPSVALALFLAIPISIVGGYFVIAIRHLNDKMYHNILSSQKLTTRKIVKIHLCCTSLPFFFGFFLTGVSVALLSLLVIWVVPYIPVAFDPVLKPLAAAFLGAGCGILVYMFLFYKHWWLLLASVMFGFLVYFIF